MADLVDTEKKLIKMLDLRDAPSPSIAWSKANRNHLAKAFGDLGFKYGAEIGVRRGNFSLKILKYMKDGKLILVDPWGFNVEGHGRPHDKNYRAMLQKTADYKDNIIIKREISTEAAKSVEDESLDFVYIDALHDFDNIMMDMLTWIPKVKKGGIVSGHDYWPAPGFGVIEATNAYAKCHNIKRWHITCEIVPSWFWVKE